MTPLEIIHIPAENALNAPPLLFVHGAYAGAWCWQGFMQACAKNGYAAYALSFRGHAKSPGADTLDLCGIDDFAQDLEDAIDTLPQPPVLIAHSMGGFVAQRYLSRGGKAAALALLASVPPYGLSGSAMYMSLFYPSLFLQLNRFELGTIPAMDVRLVRDLLFSANMPDEALAGFLLRAQRESVRGLMEMLIPQPWRHWAMPKIPALVLGGEEDKVIPQSDVLASASALGVKATFIPDIAHAMMLDTGNERVLAHILEWLSTTPWKENA